MHTSPRIFEASAETLRAIERLQPLRATEMMMSTPPHHVSPDPIVLQERNMLGSNPASMPSATELSLLNLPFALDWEDEEFKPLFLQQALAPGLPLTVIIVACEICGRSNFSTLQSVLSHGRIVHNIYYKTHEELIRQCGRIVSSPEDAERVLEHGTETSGRILLGMRSVVERGLHEGSKEDKDSLTRSLGLHTESTGLATFSQKGAPSPQHSYV